MSECIWKFQVGHWFERGYPVSVVQAGHHHAQQTDRQSALQTAEKENTDRIPSALTFHPHNNAVKSIILRNFKLHQNDSETDTIFSQSPLISFKRDKNIGNFLVRSSFQTNDRPETFKCARSLVRPLKAIGDHWRPLEAIENQWKNLIAGVMSIWTFFILYFCPLQVSNKVTAGPSDRQLFPSKGEVGQIMLRALFNVLKTHCEMRSRSLKSVDAKKGCGRTWARLGYALF